MKRKIAILITVVAIGSLSYNYLQSRSEVEPGTIEISGNIEITDAEVAFRIPGRVEERLVREGEQVKAGGLIARVDTNELAREVSLRNAELDLARATLAELEAGSRPEEIDQAIASVRRNKAELERLQSEFDRQKELYEQEVASLRDFEIAKASYDMAIARHQELSENLALVQKGPRKEKIDQARANLQRAEEALALAETRRGYATLASPLNGVVLSENVEAGEYVSAGTPVVTVGDLQNVWLRAYIDETDLGRVKVGQRVHVTADTYPGKTYEGRVSFLASEAEFTPKSVQTEKERVKLVYRIKVDIANPDMELKPGMPADAEVLIGRN